MPGHKLTKKDMSKGGKNSKRKPFDLRMQEFLEKKVKEKGITGDLKPYTREELLRLILMECAKKGNVQAAREMFDRAFGKAKQHIEMSGSLEIPATQIVINGKVINDNKPKKK